MPESHTFGAEPSYEGFAAHRLDDRCHLWVGHLPQDLAPKPGDFERLWSLHPPEYHEILIHGRKIKTPRWQQAYGGDYYYSGQFNRALPTPDTLQPFLSWCRTNIDPRLSALLLNWYDARFKHYIGKHRDSPVGMIEGTPIVTISLGEARIFRLRPHSGKSGGSKDPRKIDVPVPEGTVLIMPYHVNQTYTHEVPHFARYQGRRISITLRAFERPLPRSDEPPRR